MRRLYFHLAENMDKLMQQAAHWQETDNILNDTHRLIALQKEIHAYAEILLHMTRYYKDQIDGHIQEETLVPLVNDLTTSIRHLEEQFFAETKKDN